MKASPRFWDRIAKRYARKPVANEAVYQRKLSLTRNYLDKNAEVFEFGCGTGSTALAHAPFVRRIMATDVSPAMLEIARAKAQDAGIHNVEFACTSIEDYDGGDGNPAPASAGPRSLEGTSGALTSEVPRRELDKRFDAVLALSVLHLTGDHRAAIAKAHRLLRPGGVFVSSTVCLHGRMRWLALVAPIGARLSLLPHLDFLDAGALERDIVNAGFRICERWEPENSPTLFVIARRE